MQIYKLFFTQRLRNTLILDIMFLIVECFIPTDLRLFSVSAFFLLVITFLVLHAKNVIPNLSVSLFLYQ